MKRDYIVPTIEKITFHFDELVTASGGGGEGGQYNVGGGIKTCDFRVVRCDLY